MDTNYLQSPYVWLGIFPLGTPQAAIQHKLKGRYLKNRIFITNWIHQNLLNITSYIAIQNLQCGCIAGCIGLVRTISLSM